MDFAGHKEVPGNWIDQQMSWREKSYDVLPALSVRGRDLRQSLRIVTVAWMVGVVWMTCISGDQMRAFAKMMGFNDFSFGLMTAIGFLTTLGQLPAAILVERTGLRKYTFLHACVTHRLLWLAIAAVPFVFTLGPHGSQAAVVAVLVLLAVSNFLGNVAGPPWLTWMGDLIPRRIRGRFFARRAQLCTMIQIVVILIISVVLDYLSAPGQQGHESAAEQPNLLIAISIILAIGAICGTIDPLFFLRIREIRSPQPETRPPLAPKAQPVLGSKVLGIAHDLLIDPLKDRVFRSFVAYGAVLTLSMTITGWYGWLQARESLGFSSVAVNCLFLVIGPLSAMVTAPWWGKLIDSWGRRVALVVSTVGTLLSTLPWFVARPDTPGPQWLVSGINWLSLQVGHLLGQSHWILMSPHMASMSGAYLLCALAAIIGGSCWTGVGLAQNAIVLGFADGSGRSKYVAASSVLINVGGVAGGIVGGLIAQNLKGWQIDLGPVWCNNYLMTFVVSMVVRFGALAFLWGMPDTSKRTVSDLLKYWGENVYNNVVSRMFYPLRVFGWGGQVSQQGKDSED